MNSAEKFGGCFLGICGVLALCPVFCLCLAAIYGAFSLSHFVCHPCLTSSIEIKQCTHEVSIKNPCRVSFFLYTVDRNVGASYEQCGVHRI
jgi:hypothetical protein